MKPPVSDVYRLSGPPVKCWSRRDYERFIRGEKEWDDE
jgi:hypothetical protein